MEKPKSLKDKLSLNKIILKQFSKEQQMKVKGGEYPSQLSYCVTNYCPKSFPQYCCDGV